MGGHLQGLLALNTTLAELKFGVTKSQAEEKNQKVLESFLTGIQILPFN